MVFDSTRHVFSSVRDRLTTRQARWAQQTQARWIHKLWATGWSTLNDIRRLANLEVVPLPARSRSPGAWAQP